MTLPLYGTASVGAGFGSDKARSVVRLRAVDNEPERHAADFALVKTAAQLERALEDELAIDLCGFGWLDRKYVYRILRKANRRAREIWLPRRR